MKILYDGNEVDAKVVGTYGTFKNPIVEIDGNQYVASDSFVDPNTKEVLASMCKSHGCDYCNDHSAIGCRYGIYKNYPVMATV